MLGGILPLIVNDSQVLRPSDPFQRTVVEQITRQGSSGKHGLRYLSLTLKGEGYYFTSYNLLLYIWCLARREIFASASQIMWDTYTNNLNFHAVAVSSF